MFMSYCSSDLFQMKIALKTPYKPNYGGRTLGGSLKQAWIIRSCIGPNGLPLKNFIYAKLDHMVSWNSETGEVATIEYAKLGYGLTNIWRDELNGQ